MTASVLIGLLLQAVAVWLVHVAIAGRWFDHVGAILLGVAVAGHGGSEVVQAVFPGRNPFRSFVTQAAIDNWVVLVSCAILAYAVGYAAVVSRPACGLPASGDRTGYVEGLKLRWIVVCAAPLAVATFQGRGALQPTAPGQAAPRDHYMLTGLASQYLVLLLALIGVVIMVRYGARWIAPVAAGQVAVVSTVGARSAIVTVCVLTVFGAAMCGVRLPRRQIALVAVVAALFAITISSARDVSGRAPWQADSNAQQRITALVDGAEHLAAGDGTEAILDDFVYRLDFNTFGALVLDGLNRNRPGVGAVTVRNNLLLGVPSFLNPDKLATTVEDRNEEAFISARFGLDTRFDWLPGVFGTVVAYWGAAGLLVIALLFGLAMANAQTVIGRAASPWRLVLAIGLAQCALLYEGGPAVYVTQFRGAVTVVAVLLVLRWTRPLLPHLRRRGSAVTAS